MQSKATSITSTCSRELIDISGICNSSDVTDVLTNFPYWTQMYVSETLTIPSQKPDAEVINSISVSANILRTSVIKTPRTYTNANPPVANPNLEGKLLTGRKLIIEGELCQKVQYTANYDEQPIHSAHFYVPFSSYIVIPEEVTFNNSDNTTTTLDSLNVNYDLNSCIEDVSVCLLDNRTILKKVTLLLYAVPNQSC